MIFYFSATGNNKYVAESIAEEMTEKMVSIPECFDKDRFHFDLSEGEMLGFVFPTYFWGLSPNILEFLRKVELDMPEDTYTFYIATYGSSPGASRHYAARVLKERGITFDASFGVLMPDTWTPMFDLSDAEAVQETNDREEPQIRAIIQSLQHREKGNFIQNEKAYLLSKPVYTYYDKVARKTSHLYTMTTCIGCGLCAKDCPDHAMKMEWSQPVWVKERCLMCLRCLHRCPKNAIQYDSKALGHGQYIHPGVHL